MKKTKSKWDPDVAADLVAEAISLESGAIDEEIRTAETREDAVRRLEEIVSDAEAALIVVRGPGTAYVKMDHRELATILGALRLWQRQGPLVEPGHYTDFKALKDIATDCGKMKALTILDVDALCERLNAEGA